MAQCNRCGGVKYPGLFEKKCTCPPPQKSKAINDAKNWTIYAVLGFLLGILALVIGIAEDFHNLIWGY